jgi:uroporphyrinogen III methyltransferase / synthase
MRHTGMVYLVGAGPGRPDLLTLRGAEVLGKADAVVMDALADRRMLVHARADVEVIEAGKRGHGKVFMRQPDINALLVKLAKQGKTVVRLKGGDPYFFGRGGEEAECLHANEIPFEVVPGVSSVLAVPSYAGIPVTHRGLTSTVTVVTGHEGIENPYLREGAKDLSARSGPGVAWDRLDPRNTLVVLMGVGQLPKIAARLAEAGWPAETPAAVTQWGTLPAQKTVVGTLKDIVQKTAREKVGAPAVIVLGDVVKMRPALSWFERLPLFGRTVLVTRASAQSSELTRLLEARGARALEGPAIRIETLPLTLAGKKFMKDLASYDGVIFTSPNAAAAFAAHRNGGEWPARVRVYAVGPKTAQTLVENGFPVHEVAKAFRAEGLSSLLKEPFGKRFLFPRAEEGREVIPQNLTGRGARVDLWPVYRTVPEKMPAEIRQALLKGRVDAVTFASGSAVDSFMTQFTAVERHAVFRRARAAVLGPVTAQALRRWGVRKLVESPRAVLEDLVQTLERAFSR